MGGSRARSDDRKAQKPEEPAPQAQRPRAVGTTLSQMVFAFLVPASRSFTILDLSLSLSRTVVTAPPVELRCD